MCRGPAEPVSSCTGMGAKTSSEIMPCSRKRADGRLRAATTQRTSEADLPSRRELASQYTRARSADEREGVLHRFSSIACCVRIAVALLLPQIDGEQQQQRLLVVLPLQRASRTAHGRTAWSNQAEHGGMTCRIEITCGSVSRSSRGERWRPVEAVLCSLRKQEITADQAGKPLTQASEPRHSLKPCPPRPLLPGRKNGPGGAAPGPPGTVLVRFSRRGKSKPAAPRLRHAWAGAPRRELSKSVEFL